MDLDDDILNELFSALGAHLERADAAVTVIVVGGAALAARGIVERTTKDVDVIARVEEVDRQRRIVRAEPFPPELTAAIERVARDFGLPPDWLNAVVGRQWETGLPARFEEGMRWSVYGGLTVGLVGRGTLVALKLFAAVDQGPESVHWQDLLALGPTADEVDQAVAWVRSQDVGVEFERFVDEAHERLREELARG